MQGSHRLGKRNSSRRSLTTMALVATIAMVLSIVPNVAFAPPASAAVCAGGIVNVVAHEDDDLLFQSPDLLNDISAGRCVRTLFVTAGDAGLGDFYWAEREDGAEAAYAWMAGVANSWTTSTMTAAGKNLRVRTLNGANVSLVFMRLPDGFPLGGGSAMRGYQSVKRLLEGSINTITAVDGSNSYTASSLRNTVLDVFRISNAASVRAQDYAHGYGFSGGGYTDHYDHLSTSYVAKDASDAYAASHRASAYMGYPISGQPVNVSGTLLTRKTNAFSVYNQYDQDPSLPDYQSKGWLNRQVLTNSIGPTVVAHAGIDQTTGVGATVTLDASGSVATGTMSYLWTQTSGAPVTLSGATSVRPTFVPPSVGSYTFQVRVTNGSTSATDLVTVSVVSSITSNVARQAGVVVTASSQSSGQGAAQVVDGDPTGYPGDSTKEWATVGGRVGSWVKLTWPQPVVTNQVVLYDRPNADDQVLSGVLTFSDGSTVNVGALENFGSGTTVTFSPRATTSIQFTVNSVASTTVNVGLAEFEVYGGLDKAPTANAGPDQAVTAGAVVTLDGSGSSDPDAGTTLTYAWAQTSGPASVVLSSSSVVKPSFTSSQAGAYVFTLTVSDGVLTATDTVVVTVSGGVPAVAPTANAGVDQSVVVGSQVTLDGSGSVNPNVGATLTYAWSLVSGPAVSLSSSSVVKPTFTAGLVGTYVFGLSVTSGGLTSVVDTVAITVSSAPPVNQPPTASAGVDQSVAVGASVVLDGSGSSDPDPGTTLTYAWVKTSGPAVSLSNPSVVKPTFAATVAGTYVWSLTVSDGSLTSAVDTVTVTVLASPTADAGVDQAVTTGTVVTLDGSGSLNPNVGTSLTYAWVKTSGPAVSLSSSSVVKPTFTASAVGTYVFELRVSVGSVVTSTADVVTVTVSDAAIVAPTANAGVDQSVVVGSQVTLDGSGSVNPNVGATLTYAWSLVSGPAVSLSSSSVVKPTFTAGLVGTYVFGLSVTSGGLTSVVDTVAITVSSAPPVNQPPTASAGVDQSVAVGASVVLDGSGSSDPDPGTTLTYAWVKTSGPAVSLSNPSVVKPTFAATVAGTYVWSLTVSDGSLTSAVDTVTVTVLASPTADAGVDQAVTTGTVVTLDGSGSLNPNVGTSLTYAWVKTSGPAVSLSSSSVVKPTFTASAVGTYVFELRVSVGSVVTSTADVVTVTVSDAAIVAPTANAGVDLSVTPNTSVTLDGSGSLNPNSGATLAYAWSQTSGPATSLSDAQAVKPTFTATSTGTYRFLLTVSIGNLTSTDSVDVIVTAPQVINVARASGVTVTASSQNTSTAQTAVKAVDGSVLGYPTDSTKEWATAGGKAGSWIQLTWAAPVTLSRVVLYDRPNTGDQVTSGTLLFSDGTSVPVTSLTNAGSATTFTFAARTVTSVRLRIDAVSAATANVGLAEFEAWGYPGSTSVNRAPTAQAGPDQTVTAGTKVTLDGSSSSDPDPATTLTYAWSKTSGPAVTLTGAATSKPTFTPTAAGSYEFTLLVSDGVLSSSDTVVVTVDPAPNQAPTAVVNNQAATVNTLVTLDGSRSSDPEGGPLTYAWIVKSGPATVLTNSATSKATFTPSSIGTYVFTLTVTDSGGLTGSADTTVTVTSVPPSIINVARASGVTVTASSQNTSTAQTAVKAVDGSVLGYPTDSTKEWATAGGKAGSWIQLTWAAPVTLSRVVLYDRPNTGDQVTSGTLLFSDGTSVPVTSLTNAGSATTFTFAARTVTSVRLRIDAVSAATANVGLAEFEAWGYAAP